MPGRRPTATILKLNRGETRPARLKDDRPKIDKPPELPPDIELSDTEQRCWDYLMRTVYLPGVHGASDGAAFVKVVRMPNAAALCALEPRSMAAAGDRAF